MKVTTYAAIHDRSAQAVINDIKARRVRGYESGGQWYILPSQEEPESRCLELFEQSRSLAEEGHIEAAYTSAIEGLRIALDHLYAKSR